MQKAHKDSCWGLKVGVSIRIVVIIVTRGNFSGLNIRMSIRNIHPFIYSFCNYYLLSTNHIPGPISNAEGNTHNKQNLPVLMELMITEHTDVQYMGEGRWCLQESLLEVVKAEERNCMITQGHLMA